MHVIDNLAYIARRQAQTQKAKIKAPIIGYFGCTHSGAIPSSRSQMPAPWWLISVRDTVM